jgi:hypothetical protein
MLSRLVRRACEAVKEPSPFQLGVFFNRKVGTDSPFLPYLRAKLSRFFIINSSIMLSQLVGKQHMGKADLYKFLGLMSILLMVVSSNVVAGNLLKTSRQQKLQYYPSP